MSDVNLDHEPDDGPIRELAGLQIQPPDELLNRVHDAVHQQAVASHCLEFSSRAFLDYWIGILVMLFGAMSERKAVSGKDSVDE